MLQPAEIRRFQANLHGELIQPDHDRYEEARKVFNGMIDKRPALIARCADVPDVVAAVNFAREHELPAAVRGGGHGVTGTAVCDDGLVIDLSAMRNVQVDPENRTARADAIAIEHLGGAIRQVAPEETVTVRRNLSWKAGPT